MLISLDIFFLFWMLENAVDITNENSMQPQILLKSMFIGEKNTIIFHENRLMYNDLFYFLNQKLSSNRNAIKPVIISHLIFFYYLSRVPYKLLLIDASFSDFNLIPASGTHGQTVCCKLALKKRTLIIQYWIIFYLFTLIFNYNLDINKDVKRIKEIFRVIWTCHWNSIWNMTVELIYLLKMAGLAMYK